MRTRHEGVILKGVRPLMASARPASLARAAWRAVLLSLPLVAGVSAIAQDLRPDERRATPGQFFPPIVEPIDDGEIQALQTAVRSYINRIAAGGRRPVLVFEFRPGNVEPGQSRFGTASDLADYLARNLLGAGRTVAYVPEPLSGFAVLPVLACDEIVLGPNASLGPITPAGGTIGQRERASIVDIARLKGRDADLLLGMLEPSRDLRMVRTADGGTHFVFKENLERFQETRQVLAEEPAWGGQRGVLTADQARRSVARLLAADRAEIAEVYRLPSTALDPTLQASPRALRIKIEGRMDALSESYLLQQIARSRAEDVNLLIFDINSEGGLYAEASKAAAAIAALEDIKTIAYIDDRALGVSALIPLSCDQIIFRQGSRMGDVTYQLVGTDRAVELDARLVGLLTDQAESLAREQGHPSAIARAMVDPSAVVHLARDNQVGAVGYVLDSQVFAQPERFQVLETIKSAEGAVLTLTADKAVEYQLATRTVRDLRELQTVLNLPEGTLREARRTWVDSLVFLLNERWMKGLLLFVGFFMLVLELKLPGIGLPAITAALAFLLYFWSSYLGGTADSLEILLFLVGLICLALELFVFPGFGIFGMSGILLVLTSVVMASHTFVWPSQEYEFRQLGWTLAQVTGVILSVLVGAIVFGRYFPSLPLFNRLVLRPATEAEEEIDPTVKPMLDADATPLHFLLGEVGETTTVLRPSGKARFGEMLVDVTADGFFIEAHQRIEVIDVQGARVTVKKV